MDMYRQLGVRPVINCATTYTRLGGSTMAPHVAQAMADAAGVFVNVFELQEAVGKRLAELTRNEDAYVSNGAAAALCIATMAAIGGEDPAILARLPLDTEGLRNEVVVHRASRNWYDVAIKQAGARIVEIGHVLETFPWELDAAINERTAAVVYFAGSHVNRNTLPLEFVIERAHARGIPVIIDAAAQVPPASNLWHYTAELGADVAIFSGGKNLAGPQNSGLAVGKREFIRKMRFAGPPHQRMARSLKVSKEAMIGLVSAVEHYLSRDFEADHAQWSATVNRWLEAWQPVVAPGIRVERLEINEAGEPIPRIMVWLESWAPFTRDELVEILRQGEPGIEVVLNDPVSVAFSPHLLLPGQADQASHRIRAVLSGLAR